MEAALCLLFILPVLVAGSLSSCKLCFSKTCNPTMKGIAPGSFDPPFDAETLKRAIEGLGTDEYALSYILTSRSDSQRQTILDHYGKTTLVEDIKQDTSGGFRKAMVALASPLVEYYSRELSRAINDKDKVVLAELLSTMTPCMIREVSVKYYDMYEKELYDDLDQVKHSDLANFSPSDFAVAMQSIARGDREENTEPDEARAIADANRLKAAGVGRAGADEAVFVEVFTKRSMPQLVETLKQYKVIIGKDLFADFDSLESDIRSEFSSSALKELYIIIAKNAFDQPLYFAREIKKVLQAFRKSGKDEYTLVRIIRGRSDIDMEEIKTAYHSDTEKSLAEGITHAFATSDFSKSLLDMLNEPHD